ncbi:MAG: hypothetical protein HY465_03860 [Deltaproteobacteria bacterium]|nr:hypothetical protein [Deltaproteobacteria bacterium]
MPKGNQQRGGQSHGMTGYPEIERLIESEQFDDVNQVFAATHEELSKVATKKGGFKKSGEAKKAMRAIELVMQLFRELLTIKYQLKERFAERQKGASKSAR